MGRQGVQPEEAAAAETGFGLLARAAPLELGCGPRGGVGFGATAAEFPQGAMDSCDGSEQWAASVIMGQIDQVLIPA